MHLYNPLRLAGRLRNPHLPLILESECEPGMPAGLSTAPSTLGGPHPHVSPHKIHTLSCR